MNVHRLKIGIFDDNNVELKRTHEMLGRCMEILNEKNVSICAFQNMEDMYDENSRSTFDLVFLEVDKPECYGFQLAEKLLKRKSETRIAFISNYEKLVFDAYEYTPLWFIRKSNMLQDMTKALQKYLREAAENKNSFLIKTGTAYKVVALSEIIYIECTGHTLMVRRSGKESCSMYGSLKPVEEQLSKYGFYRIHKNYLVNRQYIDEIRRRSVILRDGTELDMGRGRRKLLLKIVK